MAETCVSCGGVVGRDCWNPADCQAIEEQQAQFYRQAADTETAQLRARVAVLEEALKLAVRKHTMNFGLPDDAFEAKVVAKIEEQIREAEAALAKEKEANG